MTRRKRWIFPAILAMISIVGMFALWRSTPYGMGLVNDSATYVEGATNLLAGKGFVRISGGGEIKPITHFPPLFSLLLAGFGFMGMDLLHAARILITILFGIDILLVGLSISKISHSVVFALLGALFLAVSDLHLGVYSFALSEPLFITLMLAAFLFLAEGFDRSSFWWSGLTGLTLSLAYLTRFAGVSLLLTTLLVILLLQPPKPIKRLGFILAGAGVPVLFWYAYSLMAGGIGSLGNRQLLWHPLSPRTLFEALKNLLTWIAPSDLLASSLIWGRMLSLVSILVLPVLMIWLGWVVWNRLRSSRQPINPGGSLALAFTQGLHVPVYLGFLVISLTFFDASTPLNDRILSVIYLPEMILFWSALAWLWSKASGRLVFVRWVIAIACGILIVFSVKDGYAAMLQLGSEGQGFAHRGLSGSPAIETIRQLSPTTLYSNKPGAIFLLTGKTAYVAPTPTDPVTGLGRTNYMDDLALLHQRVSDGAAVLILFGLRNDPDVDEAELFTDLSDNLPVMADYGEIVLFGLSQ